MENPAVSVVIPLYNKERVIGRALNSVLRQTVQNFEIVVVDDGSNDASVAVAAKLGDERLRIIQQPNSGPGAARNRGTREARSEYVAFLDADDELLPAFLETALNRLGLHTQCAMMAPGSVRGPKPEVWSNTQGPTFGPGPWRMPVDLEPNGVRWATYAIPPATVCRRRALLELGGMYENRCCFGEDIYLWLLVTLNHAIYWEPQPLMWYHTEDSELNLHNAATQNQSWAKSRVGRPLLPLLTDPVRVRSQCPPGYQKLIERYIAFEALSECQTRSSLGDFRTVETLVAKYPLMKSFTWGYGKLFLKRRLPMLMGVYNVLASKTHVKTGT